VAAGPASYRTVPGEGTRTVGADRRGPSAAPVTCAGDLPL